MLPKQKKKVNIKSSTSNIKKFIYKNFRIILDEKLTHANIKFSVIEKKSTVKIFKLLSSKKIQGKSDKKSIDSVGNRLADEALGKQMKLEKIEKNIIILKKHTYNLLKDLHSKNKVDATTVLDLSYAVSFIYDILMTAISKKYQAQFHRIHINHNSRLKHNEQQLKYQLQHTKNITDSTATIIYVADADGNINMINQAAEKTFGYTLDELKGKSLHEIIHYKYPDGKHFPIEECPLGHVFSDGKPVRNFEGVFFKKDGSPVDIICSNMPLFDNKKIIGEVLAIHDVTEMKKRDRELNYEVEKLRAVLDLLPVGVAICEDKKADRITMNRYFSDLLHIANRHPSDNQKNKYRWSSFIEGKKVTPDNHLLEQAMKGGKKIVNKEIRYVLEDNSIIDTIGSAAPLAVDGKIVGAVAAFLNITKLKSIEEELRYSERKFRSLVQYSADVIEMLDADGRITYLSDSFERVIGVKIKNAIGKNAFTHIHKDDKKDAYEKFKYMLSKNGSIMQGSYRAINGRGELRWFETTAVNHLANPYIKAIVVNFRDITEQKLIELNLKKQTQLNKLITNNASLGLLMIDKDKKCTFMNPAAESITGYTFEEIKKINKPLHDIIHNSKPDGSKYNIKDCPVHKRIPVNYKQQGEEILIRRDGTFYPVAYTISPIMVEGKSFGTVVEIRNTLIEKTHEAALIRSEEKFRHLADSMPHLVWSANPDGKVDYCNKKLFNFNNHHNITNFEDWLNHLHPEEVESAKSSWRQAMEKNEIYQSQQRIRMPDDQYRWFLTRAVPVFSDDKLIKWYATATDINDQKEAEYRFITTLKNSPIIVAQIDMKGRYKWIFNSNSYEPEILVGKTDVEVMPHDIEAHKLHSLKLQSIKSGKKITDEISFLVNKKKHTYTFVIEPILEGKMVTGLTTVAYDITDRKKFEKEKDVFIGVASHELKTPLTSVRLFTHILQKNSEKKKDKKNLYFIGQLNAQVDRMSTLINDLLNMSKIETGQLKFNKTITDLNLLVKKTIDDYQYVADHHKIEIIGGTKKKTYIDASRIEQVIINLLTNAVKYSPSANKILVKIEDKENHVQVAVQDFGIGIADGDLEKIFDRFYRIENNNKNKKEGFGLGLYIASEIIKRHNGKIWAKSSRGLGSILYFTLPARNSH